MHPPPAQFMFDFGSPNAYLCHKVLPGLALRTGVRVDYVPILLGGLFKLTNNRSPAEAFSAVPSKRAYDALEMRRFIAKHGLLAFRMNDHFPVNTLALMRGAVAAKELDCFEHYVDAVYAGMWERNLNMAQPEVFERVLTEANLDAASILAHAQDASVKARLIDNTQKAYERGAFGSPTFFVGDEIYFGKERLQQVEEQMVLQRSP